MAGKVIEVDEGQFLATRGLVSLYEQMNANPKARELLNSAAKIVRPDMPTPENDAKAEIRAELEAERTERLALQKRIEDSETARELAERTREFTETWNAKIGRLRGAGYTDEGIEKIQKLAEERGIVDLDAAAALFDKMNPPAAISQPGGGIAGLDLFQMSSQDDEDFKKLLESEGDNPAAERNMINKALTDYRSGRA